MDSDLVSLRDPVLHQSYARLVESGQIEADPAQTRLVARLDRLLVDLDRKRLSSKSSSLGWLFAKKLQEKDELKGVYIWGDVGRGKSMLMDMFFEAVSYRRKRRVHFNDFMQDAQERIYRHREAFKKNKKLEEDPIPPVARALAAEAQVLCFDEFSVTDIADAMILGRLFTGLFEAGVVVVATSNVEPRDLYRDGLNRQLFLPFIDLLVKKVDVHELGARTDFRLEKLNQAPVYYVPVSKKSEKAMDSAWLRLTGVVSGSAEQIELKGRVLPVPQAEKGVARFSFSELCEEARSAADYLALARRFHTVFIDEIPVMDRSNHNAAKRFILLIDTLYDNHVRLVASAATSPDKLYTATSGTEAFEFKRTASRLHEMQSMEYIAASGKQAA